MIFTSFENLTVWLEKYMWHNVRPLDKTNDPLEREQLLMKKEQFKIGNPLNTLTLNSQNGYV